MTPEISQQIQVIEHKRRLAEARLKQVQAEARVLQQQEGRLKAQIMALGNDLAAIIDRRCIA